MFMYPQGIMEKKEKKMEQVFTLSKATQKVGFQIIHDGPLEFSFQNQNRRFFIRETSAN